MNDNYPLGLILVVPGMIVVIALAQSARRSNERVSWNNMLTLLNIR